MGMFDRDRLLLGERLDETFGEGEEFILLDIAVMGEMDLDNGIAPARVTHLVVMRSEKDEPQTVHTLSSSIATKSREKKDGDLPAFVKTRTAQPKDASRNPTLVIQFVRPFEGKQPKFIPLEEALPY